MEACVDDFLRAVEGREARHVHAHAVGDAGEVLRHCAEGQQSEFLAHEFRAARAVEAVAYGVDEHADNEFGHGVGILSRRVFHNDAVARGGFEVDIVITCAGAYDYFKLGRSLHHFFVDDVGAHDEGVGCRNGFEELFFLCIFL